MFHRIIVTAVFLATIGVAQTPPGALPNATGTATGTTRDTAKLQMVTAPTEIRLTDLQRQILLRTETQIMAERKVFDMQKQLADQKLSMQLAPLYDEHNALIETVCAPFKLSKEKIGDCKLREVPYTNPITGKQDNYMVAELKPDPPPAPTTPPPSTPDPAKVQPAPVAPAKPTPGPGPGQDKDKE